ncbi:MAG: T9SS type A sorting domain-containing protein [Bacteroidota bacterium]
MNNGNLISTRLATVYQWLKDGQLVASANSRSYNNKGIPGSYTVLTFSETCNKRSDPFLITGIEEVEKIASDKIKIYPNPTSDFLQIESDNAVIAALIMDAVGRELRLEMEPVGEGRYRINVSAIPTGLYILKTVTKVKIDLQKIIIRK